MKHSSATERIRRKYIDQYLESGKKVKYDQLKESDGLTTVYYEDLPKTEVEGYPFASDYVAPDGTAYSQEAFKKLSPEEKKACKLRYYYLPFSHEIYVGTTGSGKTTGCIEPQLRAISSQKNKPNLFITDPKGELFERNAKHLVDCGYKTYILNFKDLIRSDKWNPLSELYDLKMQIKNMGNNWTLKEFPVNPKLKIMGVMPKDGFHYIEYNGMAFPDTQELDSYLEFEKDFLEAEIDGLINQFSNMFISVQSTKDPSWEYGAQDLLKGVLHCMLEDAVNEKSGFTADMMTIKTVQDYYQALKMPILNGEERLDSHPLLKGKDRKCEFLMSTALANAPNTMRSYCGVFDGAIKDWFQGHIFALTTGNTIDIYNDEPFAIFIVTRDYEKSDFKVAGLFIDWVYRKMLERFENGETKRALHFLLDEFGNIPEIKDFENKISTSRSRNIWFHLAVQSYKQIDVVYGADRSVIIRDNCNAQIFLGAQNRETKEIFSKECGKHSIPTLESELNPDNNTICEAALVPVSELDNIHPGEMYVKRLYKPVITSQFIRSYVAAANGDYKNWHNSDGLNSVAPFNNCTFNGPKYTFAKLFKNDDEPKPFSGFRA
ncbi:MAG: type IV secretory system conjugative DNA transfer family protein [Clostridia bacterium]|nr:type IV secretory system conjugative DNA transfer family protein [Clostridia bacterium]